MLSKRPTLFSGVAFIILVALLPPSSRPPRLLGIFRRWSGSQAGFFGAVFRLFCNLHTQVFPIGVYITGLTFS